MHLLATLAALLALVVPTPLTSPQQTNVDSERLDAARAALADGRVATAIEMLARLAEENPDAAVVALYMGHALRLEGDADAAMTQYLRGLEIEPAEPHLLIALGEIHEQGGDVGRALELYNQAIKATPDQPLGYRKAANLEMNRDAHAAAIGYLEPLSELLDPPTDALLLLGLEHFLDQRFDEAALAYERVLALEPDNVNAHYGLGNLLTRRPDQLELAVDHLRLAVAGDSTNANAYYLIGRTLADLERFDEARVALELSVDLVPDRADPHYRLAIIYTRLGDHNGARQHQTRFETLTQRRTTEEARRKERTLIMNEVAAAIRGSSPESALDAVDRLLDAYPDDNEILLLAASVWSTTGRLEQAVELADRVLVRDARSWKAHYVRGLSLANAGRFEEARSALLQSRSVNPASALTHTALGDVVLQLGDIDTAVKAFKTALALEPDVARHHLKLANTYRQLGDRELEQRHRTEHRRLLYARRLPQQ